MNKMSKSILKSLAFLELRQKRDLPLFFLWILLFPLLSSLYNNTSTRTAAATVEREREREAVTGRERGDTLYILILTFLLFSFPLWLFSLSINLVLK
jgi:hypothetical protein